MRLAKSFLLYFLSPFATGSPVAPKYPFTHSESATVPGWHNVSLQLFAELEELARIVDIAYCIGVTGIYPPFECVSRCADFKGFQLIDTWDTGPLLSDSCGYIALDHHGSRVIVAFRGTYSITNTIVDLSTIPQEYMPYPGDPEDDSETEPGRSYRNLLPNPWKWLRNMKNRIWASGQTSGDEKLRAENRRKDTGQERQEGQKCNNCTVHMGFFSSWKNTRPDVLPHLSRLHVLYPSYALHLVGHSLGGAVAALAGLETVALGYRPIVTTFGEPRVGNLGFREYLDTVFELDGDKSPTGSKEGKGGGRYRRITHIDDPVPLLPLTEWGYRMHAGEIYISKGPLSPTTEDLRFCDGDEDARCIYGGEATDPPSERPAMEDISPQELAEWIAQPLTTSDPEAATRLLKRWGLSARYRMWQLFAHRDYFWRIGLCVPGGDPINWGRKHEDGDPRNREGPPETVANEL